MATQQIDGFEGLTHCTTGLCPGCVECADRHGKSLHGMSLAISTGAVYDEGSFSWSPCEGCGSTLGGTRYAAHGVDSNGDIIHLDICEDCLLALN